MVGQYQTEFKIHCGQEGVALRKPTIVDTINTTSSTVSFQKNDHSFIHNLPIELLLGIFRLLAGAASSGGSTPPCCIAVSQVCRPWRCVAYNCEGLWTTPPLARLEWTKIALRLSGTLPLDIVWTAGKNSQPDKHALSLTLIEYSRVRSVVLEGFPMLGRKDESFGTAVHTWAVELARLGAPRLETLSISPSPWIHIIRLTKPYTSTVLGAAYFNRNIVSGDPAFQSPHAVFTTIEFQDQQPKQDLFAAILKKAAHISRHDLITLSVHKDVSSVDNNGCSVYRTKLRALTTGGGAFHLVPALRSLAATIPSVYRALSVVYSCGSSVSFIATAMRAPLHHALRMGSYFRSLAVSVPRGTTGMILTATDPRFAAGSPDLPETLVVTIPFDVVADAAPSVLGWLPLHRTATRLALECEVAPAGRRGRRAWRVLDAFFGGLATVCVRGAAAQCLVERLGAAEVGTVLGGMRSITVARVDFMGAGMGVFARLVAELRGRGRGRRLALVECDVTAEMVRRARGVLGEHAVHWDGKQRGPARLGQDGECSQDTLSYPRSSSPGRAARA